MGSVLALVGIFSTQGDLRSSQVRREIESLLAGERFSPVDISVATVLNAIEIALMVGSAASVAAIVLAVYVMRRHNPSRIALTVLGGMAALVVLASGLAGVAISIFVVYTVSLLWRRPVRSWFAVGSDSGSGSGSEPDRGPEPSREPSAQPSPQQGSPWPTDPEQPGEGGEPGRPGQPAPYPRPWPPDPEQPDRGQPDPGQAGQAGGPWQQPGQPQQPAQADPYGRPPEQTGYTYPPAPGYGNAPSYPQAYPQGYDYPSGYYGYPPPQRDPDRRPAQVVAAHVLTWVGSALGLLTALFLVIAAGSQDVIDLAMEQLGETGVSEEQFAMTMRIGGGLTALWTLAVLVVSIFSWRRANWAAILLTVMGGGYMVMQLLSLVLAGQVAVLVTIVWVTAVLVLLWWPASRQWYAGARRPDPYAPGSPYQQPPQEPPRRNQPW